MTNINNETKVNKNFLTEFVHSIFKYDSYELFFKQKPFRSFLYLVFVGLLLGTITAIPVFTELQSAISEIESAELDFPNITIKDGELSTDDPDKVFIGEIDGTVVMIDTSDTPDYDSFNEYSSGILMLQNGVRIKQGLQVRSMSYPDDYLLEDENISDVDFSEILNLIPLALASLLIIAFVMNSVVLGVFITSLFSIIYFRRKLRFGPMFNIVAHAITLPLILRAIELSVIGGIPYSDFIVYAITAMYVSQAINMVVPITEENK